MSRRFGAVDSLKHLRSSRTLVGLQSYKNILIIHRYVSAATMEYFSAVALLRYCSDEARWSRHEDDARVRTTDVVASIVGARFTRMRTSAWWSLARRCPRASSRGSVNRIGRGVPRRRRRDPTDVSLADVDTRWIDDSRSSSRSHPPATMGATES